MQGKWRRCRDPWQGFVGRWPEPIRGDSTAADSVPRPTTCDSGRCERNLRVGGSQDNRGGAQLVHKLHRECGVWEGRLRSRSAKRTTQCWGSCAYFTQDTGASVSMIAAPEEACLTINIMLNLGAQANQQDNIRKIQAPCHCRSCLKILQFLWRCQLIWSGLRPGYLQICRRSCKMRTAWSVPQHIFNKHCRASTDSLGCRSCMGRESNPAVGPLSVLHPGVWPGSCGCA